MREILPLFPLQLVLFPGQELPLHIFEPRYRQLIAECLEDGATFGIPTAVEKQVTEFGCEAKVVEVIKRYDSGELDILTVGTAAFQLEEFVESVPGKLYHGGHVRRIVNEDALDSGMADEIWELYEALHRKLEQPVVRRADAGLNLTFAIGHEIGMTMVQKVRLLSMASEMERRRYVLDHLKKAVLSVSAASELEKRVNSNGRTKIVRD